MSPITYQLGMQSPGAAPDSAALFNSAVQHFMARRLEPAEQTCRRVLELAPRHADALHLMGVLHGERGDPRGAAGYFRQVIEITPQAVSARMSLGLALQKLGELAEAEATLRHVLALSPGLAEAHLSLGRVLNEQGRRAEADECFRNALISDPNCCSPTTSWAQPRRQSGFIRRIVQTRIWRSTSIRNSKRCCPNGCTATTSTTRAISGVFMR